MKTITVDGVKYVDAAAYTAAVEDAKNKAIADTDHVIIIAHRGWVFIGYRDRKETDRIVLKNAQVVRKWTNGRGIGGLVKDAYRSEYVLDFAGDVEFSKDGVIATLKCEW